MSEISGETLNHHSSREVGNEYSCQHLIKSWVEGRGSRSSQMIPLLHKSLMQGNGEYQLSGISPHKSGEYRRQDVYFEDCPNNYLVSSLDLMPTMQKYNIELDRRLESQPKSPEPKKRLDETIGDAAWAYYAFERIHPFLDGNGRVGRMVLKRVLKGRGYKDIIFQSNAAYGKSREDHIGAMSAVGKSGNLAHLELYLLKQLRFRYANDPKMALNIDELSEERRQRISEQRSGYDVSEIWDGFKGLNLEGVNNNAGFNST